MLVAIDANVVAMDNMERPRDRFTESALVKIVCLIRDAVLLGAVLCWDCFDILFATLRWINKASYIALVMLLARLVDLLLSEPSEYHIAESVTFKSIVALTIVGSLTHIIRSYVPFSAIKSMLLFKLEVALRYIVSYTPTKAALKIQLEEEKAANICIICMDRRKEVIILNCGHMLMCSRCAAIIVESSCECPICRQAIVNVIAVFNN